MNKSIKSLLALAAFGAAAVLVSAQPEPKILVVDLAKLFDGHYKTEEQSAKLQADKAKAIEELDRMNKEGNSMVEKYKELAAQAENPMLAPEAKTKAQGDAQKVLEDIRRKQTDVQSFQQNIQSSLQQRMKGFHDLMLAEISNIAIDIAKRRGCNLLLDKSGMTLNGAATIIYSDAAYDITADVMKEINKDRPVAPAAPAAVAPTAPAASDSPNITLPGAKKP